MAVGAWSCAQTIQGNPSKIRVIIIKKNTMKFTREAGEKTTKPAGPLEERGCPPPLSPLSPPRVPWVRPWLRPAGKWRRRLRLGLFTAAPVRAAPRDGRRGSPGPGRDWAPPGRGGRDKSRRLRCRGGDAPAASPWRGAGRSGGRCGPQSAPHRPGPAGGAGGVRPPPGRAGGWLPPLRAPLRFWGSLPHPVWR